MQRDRLYVASVEDEPSSKPMYRNERVAFDRDDAQAPDVVARQIVMAADLLSHAFDGLDDAQWMAHHTVHELQHHLMDVDRIPGQS
jgi:hypothetical protein